MNQVTIHDLLSVDSPVVQEAWTRPCGLCGARKQQVCQPFDARFPLATVVHFGRATADRDKKRGKRDIK